jgi:membrane protein YdbS with pleckstrin-like domain
MTNTCRLFWTQAKVNFVMCLDIHTAVPINIYLVSAVLFLNMNFTLFMSPAVLYTSFHYVREQQRIKGLRH